MRDKYLKAVFGTCPRVLCDRGDLRKNGWFGDGFEVEVGDLQN